MHDFGPDDAIPLPDVGPPEPPSPVRRLFEEACVRLGHDPAYIRVGRDPECEPECDTEPGSIDPPRGTKDTHPVRRNFWD